jgi:hypothetical protein
MWCHIYSISFNDRKKDFNISIIIMPVWKVESRSRNQLVAGPAWLARASSLVQQAVFPLSCRIRQSRVKMLGQLGTLIRGFQWSHAQTKPVRARRSCRLERWFSNQIANESTDCWIRLTSHHLILLCIICTNVTPPKSHTRGYHFRHLNGN